MSSISSLSKMVSGLQTAQKGLQVTGHNIANVNTKGYTRQQLLQSDSAYLNVGSNGGKLMQVGLGVTPSEIRQIRDELADRRIRTENSVLNYYQTQSSVVSEIESILDEPYGESITKMLNNFWAQTQKLNTAPNGVEERLSFIQAANVLIKKANDVADSLVTYQDSLNGQVSSAVGRINDIIKGIQEYNELISKSEINGDNANDYRDQRNLLLDELSGYGEVSYYEEADKRVVVKFETHTVVNKQFITTLELKQTTEGSPFMEPIWSDSKTDVFNLEGTITSAKQNDTGKLKALLIARGNDYVSSNTQWKDIALNDNFSVDEPGNSFIIPKVQKKLNEFVDKLVSMVNESFDGTGIGTYEGVKGVQVFVPIKVPDHLRAPKEEDFATTEEYEKAYADYKKEYDSYLIPGNIAVNPELLENGGYNKLGTVSAAGDANNTGDNSIISDFLTEWSKPMDWYQNEDSTSPYYKKVNIMNFYSEFVTDIGTEGASFAAKAKEKHTSVMNIENERLAMGGVSQDEEFSNMLKYQYAYNASARMITVLDGMLDVLINKL